MFSLREVLKSLSSVLWLCVLLMAVTLPAPTRPQPHLCWGCVSTTQHCWPLEWCRDSSGDAGIGPRGGTWPLQGSCFGMPGLTVSAWLLAELQGVYEPHMLPSVALSLVMVAQFLGSTSPAVFCPSGLPEAWSSLGDADPRAGPLWSPGQNEGPWPCVPSLHHWSWQG